MQSWSTDCPAKYLRLETGDSQAMLPVQTILLVLPPPQVGSAVKTGSRCLPFNLQQICASWQLCQVVVQQQGAAAALNAL